MNIQLTNVALPLLVLLTFASAGSGLLEYRPRYHGSFLFQQEVLPDTTEQDSSVVKYPARGLVMSLAVPGLGQLYAGSKKKTALFAVLELAGGATWRQMDIRGEDQLSKYQNFADIHWDLYQWWQRTSLLTSKFADVACHGTHHLRILLPGEAVVTSDSLCSGWIEGATVIANHEFYENIGKYDQFVAGWDDLFDENGNQAWWEKEKSVGDSVEILVMTERRDKYLSMRQEYNRLLQVASYAVSAIMFNHLVSGIDAFRETNRRWSSLEIKTSMGLMFSPVARRGVGGIALAVSW